MSEVSRQLIQQGPLRHTPRTFLSFRGGLTIPTLRPVFQVPRPGVKSEPVTLRDAVRNYGWRPNR